MKTREQVLESASSRGIDRAACAMLDGRDLSRLCGFFPVADWAKLECKLADGAAPPPVDEWTRDNIVLQMSSDLAFSFEKAINKRGISSSLMYEVMKMWMWVLDDELEHMDQYAQYGLPLYKAIAVKYGLDNPIGNDTGSEFKYSDRG